MEWSSEWVSCGMEFARVRGLGPSHNPQISWIHLWPALSAEANQPPIKRWAQLATRVWWLLSCLLPWLAALRLGRRSLIPAKGGCGTLFSSFTSSFQERELPSLCFHSFTHKSVGAAVACLHCCGALWPRAAHNPQQFNNQAAPLSSFSLLLFRFFNKSEKERWKDIPFVFSCCLSLFSRSVGLPQPH